MPFTDNDDSVPAHLQLEPLDSHEFRVVRGFKYRSPEPGEPTYVVGDPGRGKPGESTDLASVPFFLQMVHPEFSRCPVAISCSSISSVAQISSSVPLSVGQLSTRHRARRAL